MTNLIPSLCMCRTLVAQLIPIIHPIKADDIINNFAENKQLHYDATISILLYITQCIMLNEKMRCTTTAREGDCEWKSIKDRRAAVFIAAAYIRMWMGCVMGKKKGAAAERLLLGGDWSLALQVDVTRVSFWEFQKIRGVAAMLAWLILRSRLYSSPFHHQERHTGLMTTVSNTLGGE